MSNITLAEVKEFIVTYGKNPEAKNLMIILRAVSELDNLVEINDALGELAIHKAHHNMPLTLLRKQVDEIKKEAKAELKDQKRKGAEIVANDKPKIWLTELFDDGIEEREIPVVSDEAFEHVKNDDTFIVRGGQLGWIKDTGINVFAWQEANENNINSHIVRKASFWTHTDDMPKLIAKPPDWIAKDILHGQRDRLKDIPALNLIVSHPFVHENEVINEKGFHRPSGYYRPESSWCEPIYPESSEAAIALIKDDLCQDFPFESEADFENALSVPITMIIRSAFPQSEMAATCAINAASPGTGKSALAKLLFAMILPNVPTATRISTEDAEITKAFISMLREGKNYAIFDNVGDALDSPAFASFTSEPFHTERILGTNSTGTFENKILPVCTGNNIQASPELVDRGFLVNLESPPERSAEREFQHEWLFDYAQKKRAETVGALCFMIQKWIDAGKPLSDHKHRMRYWAKAIGGVLTANGLGEHFLGNMMKFRRQADAESPQWANTFSAIYEKHKDSNWTIGDIFEIVSYKASYYDKGKHYPEVGDNLLGGLYKDTPQSDHTRKIAVGALFKSRIGQTLAGYKLEDVGTYHKVKRYKLTKIATKGEK